jgi:hypothetical protein
MPHLAQSTKLKPVDINQFSFYQGAQGIPFAETSREIEALHQHQQFKLDEVSARKQKPLEAKIEKLERIQPRVDYAWKDVEQRLGPHAPPVAVAVLVAGLALASLIIDAILLGPGLDMLGISDPVLQYVAAFGIAALAGVLFHFVHQNFMNPKVERSTRIIWRIAGGVAVCSLICWGILRALQLRFSSELGQNPLGGFLGAHPILSAIFFSFITLAVPIVGAAAIFYSEPPIHNWLVWKRAKAGHDGLHTGLSDARKKLDEEQATLKHQREQLDAQKNTWQASAAQYHDRGQRRGARQVPLWLVILKATLWSLGGIALGWLVGPFLPPLYVVLPAAAWIAAFLYYQHRRFHPSYREFKNQENTRFAISSERRPPVEMPVMPKMLLAPEEYK